ncbi:MAG: bifunctional demethylmenaquinone methyltransferase/2-methoxy-6-polyprenyl-1,4-benzoquinol methylase UbiE [Gammaproteobacteria bacterium]|nr:bifunctional demethylmenaquinone methyltransferase/2-methoxy-6-polyprenyl-1,4-benzoquinol methylase UbiE [Gammaproteobacteria bacterium]MCP4476315.1 bifunctional demethylmenaquinone methyltransferase/2-methoxy-6-polyprenyl-1,4-benzoquinol methylase UbiE [Gammaproteobacteria bacterium]
MKSDGSNKTAWFGFEKVAPTDKQARVSAVFHSVAGRYDLMNDIMSLGLHRLWKRYAIDRLGVRPGQRVLDLACGSGDLTRQLARRVGQRGCVVAADINPSMLAQARQKLVDSGIVGNVDYVEANAEALPFNDDEFDAIIIAFGLRNVPDQLAALVSMLRVLKPGGRLVILEFSKVTTDWLQKLYDHYSFKVIPKIGKLVTGDEHSYRYLVESIRKHPDQQALTALMTAAGWRDIHYDNLHRGLVALHSATKVVDGEQND